MKKSKGRIKKDLIAIAIKDYKLDCREQSSFKPKRNSALFLSKCSESTLIKRKNVPFFIKENRTWRNLRVKGKNQEIPFRFKNRFMYFRVIGILQQNKDYYSKF